jgi:quercetin dioxygenase-like cupin family protein
MMATPVAEPVTSANSVDWTPFKVENSQGFNFKFGLIGSEYTGAYSVDLVSVDVGGYSPRHVDPDNHAFYIISGTGEIAIQDRTWQVGPGSVVKIPVQVVHSVKNIGDVPLLFLTIYDPPRKR